MTRFLRVSISPLLSAVCFLTLSSPNLYALEPMNDQEMSNITGQEFITIDTSAFDQGAGDWSGDYEFTKVNLGMQLETLFNIKELQLGRFGRTAYQDGTVPVTDDDGNIIYKNNVAQVYNADLIINDFALGRVDNYDDGSLASIVPFMAENPYIELAYRNENGERSVAGIRVGFERAQGDLSGELVSVTGVVEGQIRGDIQVVYDNNCSGFNALAGNCLLLAASSDQEIYTQVDLLDGSSGNGADQLNTPYLKRASWFGVPTGRNFETDETGLIASLIPSLTTSNDCEVLGTPACFRSTSYESIYIGDQDNDFETGSAAGVFLSVQLDTVPWEDLSGIPGSNRVLTERGAFMNIARYQSGGETKYPLYLTLENATRGSPRVATCIGRIKGC